MNYLIPAVLFISVLVAAIKKISVYDSFIEGCKEAVKLTLSILPYLMTIFIMVELLNVSGINKWLTGLLSKPFSLIGIPLEIIELVLIRPLSGSGSIVLTEKIIFTYGADSYLGKCASVISGCSDTVFYIAAVYLSQTKDKRTFGAIPIALFSNLCGNIFACLICRFL